MNTDIDNLPLETVNKLLEETDAASRRLRDRKEQIENANRDARLEHIKPLVIRAHDVLCSWNHTDGCGWGYEIDAKGNHDWKCWSHARWLRHFEELLLGTTSKSSFKVTPDELSKMLDAVEDLRKINPGGLWIIRNGLLSP